MRRILEHYFRILGGIGYDEILDLFDGEERLVVHPAGTGHGV